MRPHGVGDVIAKHGVQVAGAEDENVVEALAPHRAEEALTSRVDRGERTGHLMTRMPAPRAARSKSPPNLLSRSRMMNWGPSPKGVAFRSCCATQVGLGER